MDCRVKPGNDEPAGRHRAPDGFVMVAVLWILGALATLASIYSVYIIDTAVAFKAHDDRLQAEGLVSAALELTALEMGVPGKDNTYGSGKIRCAAAARRLLVLGRFDTQSPGLGAPVTLDVFGPPSEVIYAFISAGIHDDATDWNLDSPFLFFGVMPLDGSGHLAVPAVVPNDPTLAGVTAWFQFGAQNHVAPGWGPGPLISVPESITVAP